MLNTCSAPVITPLNLFPLALWSACCAVYLFFLVPFDNSSHVHLSNQVRSQGEPSRQHPLSLLYMTSSWVRDAGNLI